MTPRFLTIIIIALAAVAGTLAMAKCSTMNKHKCNAHNSDPECRASLNPVIEDTDTLTKFRFERHEVNAQGNTMSEVLSLSASALEPSHYLYYRFLNSNTGISWSSVDGNEAMQRLSQVLRENPTDSLPCIDFDDEDKARTRSMIRAEYKSGKKMSVVDYSDSPAVTAIAAQAHDLFQALAKRSSQFHSEHSESTYDASGKLLRRIDYTADGIVHGGYDATKPDATF